MAEGNYNPAVNPVVISDFTSNAAGRRYASTTDDLLDRIKNAVENIAVEGGGTPLHFRQIMPMWVYFESAGTPYGLFSNAVFRINNIGILEPVGVIFSDTIIYMDSSLTLSQITSKPIVFNQIGRLSGNLAEVNEYDFNPSLNLNILDKRILSITKGDNNIFSLEVVVLPDTLLNNDVNDNYFEVEINGVARKYFLDSFNGIPIINRIFLEDFANIETVKVTPNTGVQLEYTIKYTYPNLP